MSARKPSPPKEVWIQYDNPVHTTAYFMDPRMVHDNGRPVYRYTLAEAPAAKAKVNWAPLAEVFGFTTQEVAEVDRLAEEERARLKRKTKKRSK